MMAKHSIAIAMLSCSTIGAFGQTVMLPSTVTVEDVARIAVTTVVDRAETANRALALDGPSGGYPAPLAVTTDTTTNVVTWGYATNHFEIVHTNGTLFLTNLWAGATHAQHAYVYLHNSNAQPWSVQGVTQWVSNGNFTASMPPTAQYNELMFQRDVRGVVKGYVVVTNGVSP